MCQRYKRVKGTFSLHSRRDVGLEIRDVGLKIRDTGLEIGAGRIGDGRIRDRGDTRCRIGDMCQRYQVKGKRYILSWRQEM